MCSGAEPSRILQFIESSPSSGATILSTFGKPPYGYPADVVRACLAGLLRARKIRIRPDGAPDITSILDPGTRDLFRRDRDTRRADSSRPARAREAARPHRHRRLLQEALDIDLEPENDPITDAVFQQFPACRERLREVETLLDRLPGRPHFRPPSGSSPRRWRTAAGRVRSRTRSSP